MYACIYIYMYVDVAVGGDDGFGGSYIFVSEYSGRRVQVDVYIYIHLCIYLFIYLFLDT